MRATPAREVFGYATGWGLPSDDDQRALREVMKAPRES